MDNKSAEELLLEKRKACEAMGGPEAIKKQHEKGKLTARERISLIVDKGSFLETGEMSKTQSHAFGINTKNIPCDGVVAGCGQIDGRPVWISSQDFTVSGGSLGLAHARKIVAAQKQAFQSGCPMISINDSGGARIQEGVDALCGFGEIFFENTRASGVIPQISIILGPCAGGAVYSPGITDFIFTVEGTSQLYITGPEVIATVTGEHPDSESLGGAKTHTTKSGVAHFFSTSEEECMRQVKKLLTYLPQNYMECPPKVAKGTASEAVITDDPNRATGEIASIIPSNRNAAYDVRDVIKAIADGGDFFESSERFAPNIVTGFIRLNGKSTGVIASQPKVKSGCLDIDASDKAARFVRMLDAFGLPILTLTDVPGFLPGVDQEHGGIIRHGAKLLYAYCEATVPKVNLILRKAFGGAYIAMCSKHLGGDFVFSLASAQVAVMGSQGAAAIIFNKEIKASSDPEAKKAEKIAQYENEVMNPYVAAEKGYVDAVITCDEVRPTLIRAFLQLESKSLPRVPKKHGNIPL